MCIVGVVREGYIRANSLQRLENDLNLGAVVRKKAIAKVVYDDLLLFGVLQEMFRAVASLRRPLFVRAENDPADFHGETRGQQSQDRAPTADLNVIRVRPKTKNLQRSRSALRNLKV